MHPLVVRFLLVVVVRLVVRLDRAARLLRLLRRLKRRAAPGRRVESRRARARVTLRRERFEAFDEFRGGARVHPAYSPAGGGGGGGGGSSYSDAPPDAVYAVRGGGGGGATTGVSSRDVLVQSRGGEDAGVAVVEE